MFSPYDPADKRISFPSILSTWVFVSVIVILFAVVAATAAIS